MTACAETGLIIALGQVLELAAVRFMAARANKHLLRCRVDDFTPVRFLAHRMHVLLVTALAQIDASLFQKMVFLRGMLIVTLQAVETFQRLVRKLRRLNSSLSFAVALEANIRDRGLV